MKSKEIVDEETENHGNRNISTIIDKIGKILKKKNMT